MKQFVLSSAALWMLLFSYSENTRVEGHSRAKYTTGDYVDDFGLANYTGKRIYLHDFKGKGLILVFIRNSCEYCNAYKGRIKDLAFRYAPLGIPLIAINPFADRKEQASTEDIRHMKQTAERERFSFPYLADEELKLTTLFGVEYTPKAAVLDRSDGRFRLIYSGDIDNDPSDTRRGTRHYVQDVVKRILAIPR